MDPQKKSDKISKGNFENSIFKKNFQLKNIQ